MSVHEIKQQLAAMQRTEQDEVIAFLFHLRHAGNQEHESRIKRRMDDKDPSHWLSPTDFEREIDKGK